MSPFCVLFRLILLTLSPIRSFNFLIVLITPIAFARIRYNTYTVFAVINAFIFVSTFFIFPETKGRSLEEMDDIFSRASKVNPFDVVLIERKTPKRYDSKGRPIGLLADMEENAASRSPNANVTDEKKQQAGSVSEQSSS